MECGKNCGNVQELFFSPEKFLRGRQAAAAGPRSNLPAKQDWKFSHFHKHTHSRVHIPTPSLTCTNLRGSEAHTHNHLGRLQTQPHLYHRTHTHTPEINTKKLILLYYSCRKIKSIFCCMISHTWWVFKWTYLHLLIRARSFSSWWCKFSNTNIFCA